VLFVLLTGNALGSEIYLFYRAGFLCETLHIFDDGNGAVITDAWRMETVRGFSILRAKS
jgi:hypothetical protein